MLGLNIVLLCHLPWKLLYHSDVSSTCGRTIICSLCSLSNYQGFLQNICYPPRQCLLYRHFAKAHLHGGFVKHLGALPCPHSIVLAKLLLWGLHEALRGISMPPLYRGFANPFSEGALQSLLYKGASWSPSECCEDPLYRALWSSPHLFQKRLKCGYVCTKRPLNTSFV